ncbi:hypothetical protein A2U01_0090663 [Trifolium medium]|uniref:Uncharacterized protein n=1 Tax=Trifolium medium TaxID=97028 RepID=A0A392U7B1_9FABA|nr:hypothetical protein [Trifolium medium]
MHNFLPPARRAACSGAARSAGNQGRFDLRVTARRVAKAGAARSLALFF